jgi:hypothetical protein
VFAVASCLPMSGAVVDAARGSCRLWLALPRSSLLGLVFSDVQDLLLRWSRFGEKAIVWV